VAIAHTFAGDFDAEDLKVFGHFALARLFVVFLLLALFVFDAAFFFLF
jgi:hypothetical protein